MKKKNGVSLIVLVITIIVMIILAVAIILSLTNNKIFNHAEEATNKTTEKQYEQEIQAQYALVKNSKEMIGKTTKEIFEKFTKKLNIPVEKYTITSKSVVIKIDPKNTFTLIDDGQVIKGSYAYLDIADGSIEIYVDRYAQGKLVMSTSGYTKYEMEGETTSYTGGYIITGSSTENAVRVMDIGTYDINLKNLNIDMSQKSDLCAFNANRKKFATGVYVNLNLEGENFLKSGAGSPGLGFTGGTPNLNGVTNGSTLTIHGNGSLYAEGGTYSAGIGSGYNGSYADRSGGPVNNIIINGGNITAKSGGSYCCAIGSQLYGTANNIVINGGSIYIKNSQNGGIGIGARGNNSAGTAGIAKALKINGGDIIIDGTRSAIGGEKGSEDVIITGGKLTLKNTSIEAVLGDSCSQITITGGTIICNSANGAGVGTKDITKNINIIGGSIQLNVAGEKFAVEPKSGEYNVYLTEVALENVIEETLVTSLTTSDNISYGIKDMYTSVDGKLYLYLPLGERTITIVANGKTYSGQVTTSENVQEVLLKEI